MDRSRADIRHRRGTDPSVLVRLSAGITAVARVERAEHSLPASTAPTVFWARDRVVRRPQIPEDVERLIPRPLRAGWAVETGDVQELTARLRADALVLAKFDIRDRVKLRAAYSHDGLTVSIQPPVVTGLNGVERAVLAHRIVDRHAPGLMPSHVAHGALTRGLPYLVERWLDGSALGSAVELDKAAPEILSGLASVHAGHGVRRVALSTAQRGPLLERWRRVRQTGIIPEPLGDWVAQLIDRDLDLRWSWTHGDMVASNVVRTASGIVLVDWEHSSEAPIMRDAAKLHLYAADPERTLDLVLSSFDPRTDQASYSLAEDLALSHVELLNRYPLRRQALAGHARAEIYERQVRRQVERLAQVQAAA